jgi:hypothetical protein
MRSVPPCFEYGSLAAPALRSDDGEKDRLELSDGPLAGRAVVDSVLGLVVP